MASPIAEMLLRTYGGHVMEAGRVLIDADGQPTTRQDAKFSYTFETFFHPFVGELIEKLNKGTLGDMMDPEWLHTLTNTDFFTNQYNVNPRSSDTVALAAPPPVKSIGVGGGPYDIYNWEMLYHFPVAAAVHLTSSRRFAEARRWFHLVFDPTSTDPEPPGGHPTQRFWKFLGFRYPEKDGPTRLDDLLVLLSTPDHELDDTGRKNKQLFLDGYNKILENPFQPHAVARTRPVAYQYYVVMKYLDNLIAAGDQLFTQFTVESLAEATLYYVLAATLLGDRPQQVPPRGTIRPKSFAELNAPLLDSNGQPITDPTTGKVVRGLDAMGNALVELEAKFPFNLTPPAGSVAHGAALFGIGRTLYFCVPPNEKMLGYWDTVADRLFKIRHCMDIEGVVRPLPLFDPPLDPGMLVKAAAAGIDVSSIVAGTTQPIGPVRCQLMIQKALELAGEVRGLGGTLLATLEKHDGEKLAMLRQDHEIKLQQLSRDVKFLQWRQAQSATDALLRTRETTVERYKFYLRLLGQQPDANAPDTLVVDRRELTAENFDDAYQALVAQYDKTIATQAYPPLKLAGEGAPANQSGATGAGNLYLNANEDEELNKLLPMSRDSHVAANALNAIAAVVTFIPDIGIKAAFWGLGADARVFGGDKMANALRAGAEIASAVGSWAQEQAGMASRTAGYERRADEWRLQANTAARELMQTGRQILSSLIAEQVAHHEYKNAEAQIAQSEDVKQFLEDKFTNEDLYGWMQGEVSRLYYEYYRFAVDVARRAERTMKHELMRPEVDATDYIKFNYWDAGRKGLVAGDALQLDIKQMELAYHENNKRELELTRHVSLRQLDPHALLSLKLLGRCEVTIPEWLYDLDCPGLYMRRIQSVALSLPSVVGPYASVNCTLTQLRSTVRKKPDVGSGYPRDPNGDDPRFVDYVGGTQSIVTSSGTNDSGMFETNLRDERFLWFQGTGAASTWRLELPGQFPAFDYSTIADAILHVRYTARHGGETLAVEARKELARQFKTSGTSGLALFFSLRHDFPTEWSAFVHGSATTFATSLKRTYFPYFAQGKHITIDALDLFEKPGVPIKPTTLTSSVSSALGAGDAALVLDKVPKNPAANVFLVMRYSLS